MKSLQKQVEALAKKAAKAEMSDDATKFAQAALDLARTIQTLADVKRNT